MYSNVDYFATPKTIVSVDRQDNGEVFVRIKDDNFGASIIMDRNELSNVVGTFERFTFHNGIRFPNFTFFDKPEGKVDELKFTLEMI